MSESIRSILANCLNKIGGTLSVRENVLGIYADDNSQDRSVREQLDHIQNRPFVRVALVTIRPQGSMAGVWPNLQRDVDNANIVYKNECNAWVYPVGSQVINTNILGTNVLLDQNDCNANGHNVSDEEDDLFELGRNMGAEVVAYFINGDVAGFAGCAAHPQGRRGFWVGAGESPWTFAHELTHVVGGNPHPWNDPDIPDNDQDNLMWTPTGGQNGITNLPPDLRAVQCNRIMDDDTIERC
jgi:hypothetical protein